MQTRGRFVQHVQHVDQRTAESRVSGNSLSFAAGKRSQGTVKLQVAESDILQEFDPSTICCTGSSATCVAFGQVTSNEESRPDVGFHRQWDLDSPILYASASGLNRLPSQALQGRYERNATQNAHVHLVLLSVQPIKEAF